MILAIDLGTFCDNQLMENALSNFEDKYDIVYLTDKNHKVPDQYIKEYFETPHFLLDDPKLKVADTNKSLMLWSLLHPKRTYKLLNWNLIIKKKLQDIFQKYDIKKIFILYPALSILFNIEESILDKIPTFVLYYAPGFLNKTIPWLFDSKMKKIKLYMNDPEENIKSGMNYLKRLQSIDTVFDKTKNIKKRLQKVYHVYCWDKNITKSIKPYFKLKTFYIGSLIQMNSSILNIPYHERYIFMSFGSYKQSLDKMEKFIPKLEKFAIKHGMHVIFHNGNYDSDIVTSIKGFIPYHEMVKKSSLVIFTGSACLQNICFYHAVPMFFMPLLNEQYFWAKNYHYFTDTNFYNLESAIHSEKIKPYLEKVSKSMQKTDSSFLLRSKSVLPPHDS